ncbi:MAG: hypothetical protein EXS08_16840 [Planctomycetes bacterium]|nr:hypothetical protein [Planctomycetota bacterium]
MSTFLALLCALAAQRALEARPVEATAPLVRPPEAHLVPLGELRANPGAFLGEDVLFALQFHQLDADWDPYLSRFDPARWVGVEVWADESFTWERAVFEHPFTHLYLRKGGGFEPLARRAHPYQRFLAHARVREVFLGEPWLELLELEPLEGEVGEGTLVCMTRARALLADGQYELALDQYQRAKSAPLPPHALAMLLREIHETEQAQAEAKRKSGEKPDKLEKTKGEPKKAQ